MGFLFHWEPAGTAPRRRESHKNFLDMSGTEVNYVYTSLFTFELLVRCMIAGRSFFWCDDWLWTPGRLIIYVSIPVRFCAVWKVQLEKSMEPQENGF